MRIQQMAALAGGETRLVSVSTNGAPANAGSYQPSISASGRYITFESDADSLVEGDTNRATDVFVRDSTSGKTRLVSANAKGVPGNKASDEASISADGRRVAFVSHASNLVEGDDNEAPDLFVRDLETGVVVRVTAGNQGGAEYYSPVLSADGRFVAFASDVSQFQGDPRPIDQVFVHDFIEGKTKLVSTSDGRPGNRGSFSPSISADGRYVAFISDADNLVEGDKNERLDILVRDMHSQKIELASVASSGAQANDHSFWPSLSGDGRQVAFHTLSDNLVQGDTNDAIDVFVHDLASGQTGLASANINGAQGNGSSERPILSADGRHVAFQSRADNLAEGDTNGTNDVMVRDMLSGEIKLASVSSAGVQGRQIFSQHSLSADGRHVVFHSESNNLVHGDNNGATDIFVHTR